MAVGRPKRRAPAQRRKSSGCGPHVQEPPLAYARLKAGDYKAAASGFGAFNDTDGQYDRGNALARAGDLRDALAAYNAALAKDPGNKDARHNLELVEKALRRRRLSHHKGGNGGSKEDAPRPNATGGGQSARAAKSVGSQSSAGRLKRKEGRKSGRESATGVQNPNSGRADAGPNITDEKNLFGNREPGDKKARARRDAQAAATASGEHKFRANPFASHERRAETSGQNGKHKPQAPASEQQLALQQWLRRIPNDPAGLLKRKFVIEHLMRQQKAQR